MEKLKEYFMKQALKEAEKAYNKLEVPVGAIIVKDGKIIARAHNQKETKTDTTKHAEITVIQKASKKLKSWRLIDCEMYVTLEPCTMCAGAIINSRIKKVYIGAMDEKTGAVGSVFNLFEDYKFNHTLFQYIIRFFTFFIKYFFIFTCFLIYFCYNYTVRFL